MDDDDDDDVYYYIRWRLKLEGETENTGVCTKGVTAADDAFRSWRQKFFGGRLSHLGT